jgi:dipeptidyl aminopeptidase/acylaminoacyl peptidase
MLAAVLFSSVGAAATEPAPLIPREVLFGNPTKSSPQISPDGKYLAYLAPDKKNVLQVWVRTVGQEDDKAVTNDPKRGIRFFQWAYDGEHLLYLQDIGGDENFHVYAASMKTTLVRDLTPFQGVRAAGLRLDPKFPHELLISLNAQNRTRFDMYRVSLRNGACELDTENPGLVLNWVADAEFKIRAGLQATLDGGYELLVRDDVKQPWRKVKSWSSEEQGSPLGFSADGKTLYLIANHDANTMRFLALDLATGKETVVTEDPEYDVTAVMLHPTRHVPQIALLLKEKQTLQVLDPSIAEDVATLQKVRSGEMNLVNRTLDDQTWVVAYSTDDGPTYYYTYDRKAKAAKLLFSSRPELENRKLAQMKPIQFKSRDGLLIRGYLTTPVGIEAKNLPTVLLVHGGPWGRDAWGFQPEVQWLANRGYAVLQVNFRGSTGYGKQFLNAGNREWAAKMHDDLLDAVEWIVKEGVADKTKIAIMGGSYGGYATLVGLTFSPDVFCCGVDIVGPSNILTLLSSIPPYWAPMKAMFVKRVGDPVKDETLLKSRSPLFKVDAITKPLLIGQGANDPRVKQAESDQIYEAMKKAGKPVQYVIYTDEGHGFARPENRLHFYAVTEEFLAKYLGGRVEPVGEIKGHSAVIKQ